MNETPQMAAMQLRDSTECGNCSLFTTLELFAPAILQQSNPAKLQKSNGEQTIPVLLGEPNDKIIRLRLFGVVSQKKI
jgi:hypothetical protein